MMCSKFNIEVYRKNVENLLLKNHNTTMGGIILQASSDNVNSKLLKAFAYVAFFLVDNISKI